MRSKTRPHGRVFWFMGRFCHSGRAEARYSRVMLGSTTDVSIRRARAADAAALVDIYRDSWRLAYRGIIPHLHLEMMIQRRGIEWWRSAARSGEGLLVLDVAGTLAGYATHGTARTKGPYRGEIYELYLAPTHQGLGLGEHLFEACRHRLDQRRLPGLIVWALVDNSAATSFYWRRGGRPVASTVDRIGGTHLEKVAFAWD